MSMYSYLQDHNLRIPAFTLKLACVIVSAFNTVIISTIIIIIIIILLLYHGNLIARFNICILLYIYKNSKVVYIYIYVYRTLLNF
jgi:hypothetical protein